MLAVLGAIALLNAVLGFSGIAQEGSSTIRWVIAGLWLATGALCLLAWRRQVRRFDRRAAEIAREEEAAGRDEPGAPSA